MGFLSWAALVFGEQDRGLRGREQTRSFVYVDYFPLSSLGADELVASSQLVGLVSELARKRLRV